MLRTFTRAALFACIVTFLGCPPPPPPVEETPDASTRADGGDAGGHTHPDASTGSPDASTDAGQQPTEEWDGSYVPLPETGSIWTDPGLLSPCDATAAGGNCEDFSSFDLSRCDPASLANVDTSGQHLLTTRFHTRDGGYNSISVYPFGFGSDGGTTAYLGGLPATELRDGNTRLYTTLSSFSDGGTRRATMVTCSAPQAPDFTGCYALCRNGVMTNRATVASTRLLWREGESQASGLELVSERRVDIGYAADVYVTQNHAYVVSLNIARRGLVGGLSVFDVRNKAAPVLVKTIQMSGDTYWNGVWAKGNALYVASQSKLVVVFDITNPADPQFVRTLGTGNGHTVFVDGNRLYATGGLSGVHIYDVTTPTNPVELARYAPNPANSPHDMLAVGNRLYVNYGSGGYFIADTSDLNNLRTLGHYSYAVEQYSHANAVGTFGGRTISFTGGEGPGEHLRVLDITDPARILKIGEFQLRAPISIHNMVLVGRKLYLSWYQEGVRVLDVSNPTRPTQVAYFNTYRENDPHRGDYYDGAIGIRVPGDGYVYTVDTGRGLLILREK